MTDRMKTAFSWMFAALALLGWLALGSKPYSWREANNAWAFPSMFAVAALIALILVWIGWGIWRLGQTRFGGAVKAAAKLVLGAICVCIFAALMVIIVLVARVLVVMPFDDAEGTRMALTVTSPLRALAECVAFVFAALVLGFVIHSCSEKIKRWLKRDAPPNTAR